MNAYFFKMTNEERNNILDQHKEIYDGYVTSYAQQPKEQPLYTQDFANDKQGITVSNKGVVTGYKNMNINEMKHDGKSTGLFSNEEKEYNEGYISAGTEYAPEETFEGLYDMIGDGKDDLEHGVFGLEDEEDRVLISPEIDFNDEDNFGSPSDDYKDRSMYNPYYGDDNNDDELVFNLDDKILDDEDDMNDEEVAGLFDDLSESLDMFKRFTKYN